MNVYMTSRIYLYGFLSVMGVLVLSSCTSSSVQFRRAIRAGNVQEVEKLLAKGADGNVQDKNGNTPLHLAVRESNVDIVRLLVNQGANINVQDKNGNTPLHLAVRKYNVDIARLLVDQGADIDVTNNKGRTARQISPPNIRYIIHRLIIPSAFREAQQLDTIESYRAFISSNPSDELVEEAKNRIVQLEFAKAKKIDTVKGYYIFLHDYRGSSLAKKAERQICQKKLEEAQSEDTIAAYEGFVKKHGPPPAYSKLVCDSGFLEQARVRIKHLSSKRDQKLARLKRGAYHCKKSGDDSIGYIPSAFLAGSEFSLITLYGNTYLIPDIEIIILNNKKEIIADNMILKFSRYILNKKSKILDFKYSNGKVEFIVHAIKRLDNELIIKGSDCKILVD